MRCSAFINFPVPFLSLSCLVSLLLMPVMLSITEVMVRVKKSLLT